MTDQRNLSALPRRLPRTIYIAVSTECLGDLSEWSGPVQIRVDQDLRDDTYELIVRRVDV